MIKGFNLSKKRQDKLEFLLEYIKTRHDPDFYLTRDNKRLYIESTKLLETLLKSSITAYVSEGEDGDYDGLILAWKSSGGNIKRYYIKIVADSPRIADRLLTVLYWNFHKELYIKINKRSPLLNTFRAKGFKFEGGRGKQLLLKRDIFSKVRQDRGAKQYVRTSQRH